MAADERQVLMFRAIDAGQGLHLSFEPTVGVAEPEESQSFTGSLTSGPIVGSPTVEDAVAVFETLDASDRPHDGVMNDFDSTACHQDSSRVFTCYAHDQYPMLGDPLIVAGEVSIAEDGVEVSWRDVTEHRLDPEEPAEPPAPVRLYEPISQTELDAALAPAVEAWLPDFAEAATDVINRAAESLLVTNRPVPDTLRDGHSATFNSYFGTTTDTAYEIVAQLAYGTQPADDLVAERTMALLSDLSLSVRVPHVIFQGSSYLVNEDVMPGSYKATDVENCYWETLDETGEINDGNFVNAAPQVIVTILETDFAFNNDCGVLVEEVG